ncbi:MAG: hypothetical protein ABIO86_16835, partial [Sphingomonas sp.]
GCPSIEDAGRNHRLISRYGHHSRIRQKSVHDPGWEARALFSTPQRTRRNDKTTQLQIPESFTRSSAGK